MENNGLFNLFIDQLEDMLSSENQILKGLPKMINAASLKELKEVLSHHLEETQNQVQRIKQIFTILNLQPKAEECKAMKGLIQEAEEMIQGKTKATLDAAIIAAAQKIEHYKIASYGTLKSFAKHLKLDSEVIDLIQETLDEVGNANKKLTRIADGSFFSSGVNKEAAVAR